AGGITTISNFISHPDGEPLSATLQKANDTVKAEAIADVILHLRITDPKRYTPADLALLAKGYTLKIFTSLPNFDPELPAFTQFIEDAGKAGLMTMLHCEDRSV